MILDDYIQVELEDASQAPVPRSRDYVWPLLPRSLCPRHSTLERFAAFACPHATPRVTNIPPPLHTHTAAGTSLARHTLTDNVAPSSTRAYIAECGSLG